MKSSEYTIIQNSVLGALAIHTFAKSYYKAKDRTSGPSIALCMPILPIVFNEKCYTEMSKINRITSSRFLSLLSDNRDIPVGLQKRMVDMSTQTFQAINMAFALKLLTYNPENTQLLPAHGSNSPIMISKDNQEILQSSKVLGSWFANYSLEDLCVSLNIIF